MKKHRDPKQIKVETTIKNFRYNRFLLLRYSLAGFFFTNLYWAIALLLSKKFAAIVPIFLLLLAILAAAEHIRLYGYPSNDVSNKLRFNLLFQKTQLTVNIIAILATVTNAGFLRLYPFLTSTSESKIVAIVVLLIGVFLSIIVIKRILAIYKQKDKYLFYINNFLELHNLERE